MIKKNINDDIELEQLCDIATDICNLPKGHLSKIFPGCKAEKYSVPRTIVAVIARKDLGIHHKVIANYINKDRSSIYHYVKKHESDYASYPEYRNKFNEIYNAHTEMTKEKEEFKNESEILEFLAKRGIKNSKFPTMFITIKTENFAVNIGTTFRDFSNYYDICNESLKNYKVKISIRT
ncbi:MAG: hypothetical protein Tp165SUR256671_7 [Prokaryotic dsDNA virus sp.]|nr:MAG: hypothetical protein Tp165SUR256671_7 [Prokaryotic dsDNA virus sp.]|tara:strand:- start:397 stop:933 length:537 start_codon:yes stop_codon:yes gene_type:complete